MFWLLFLKCAVIYTVRPGDWTGAANFIYPLSFNETLQNFQQRFDMKCSTAPGGGAGSVGGGRLGLWNTELITSWTKSGWQLHQIPCSCLISEPQISAHFCGFLIAGIQPFTVKASMTTMSTQPPGINRIYSCMNKATDRSLDCELNPKNREFPGNIYMFVNGQLQRFNEPLMFYTLDVILSDIRLYFYYLI